MIDIIILSILAFLYVCGILMVLETKTGNKIFRFIMSFIITNEQFEAKDWKKPIPMWQSLLIWLIMLGMFGYYIFGLFTM